MWCYTILALIMTCLMVNIEAGRTDAQTLSLVRYPIVLGLVGQLFGISVMVPLLWIPFYIFSHGNGPPVDLLSQISHSKYIADIHIGLPGIYRPH